MDEDFSAIIGFDGFIDEILEAVDVRFGTKSQFRKIQTIPQFAQRIHDASQTSTNIELYPLETKIGGNGPILANSLASLGVKIDLWGALGEEKFHPIFKNLHPNVTPYTLSAPGRTSAIEFKDGKLLLGITCDLDNIDLKKVKASLSIQKLQHYAHFNLLCFTNWTMIIHMNDIIQYFANNLPPNKEQIFFFDIADPSKRSVEDLRNLCFILRKISKKFYVILGLNFKEAQNIYRVFSQNTPPLDVSTLGSEIYKKLNIDEIFIHEIQDFVAYNRTNHAHFHGEKIENPKTLTGAGDHFNAGYLYAKLLKKPLQQCLLFGDLMATFFIQNDQDLQPQELLKMAKNLI